MRKLILIAAMLCTSLSLSLASGPVRKVKADLEKSQIRWYAEKVTGEHDGLVNLSSAELGLDSEGNIVNGNFEVDMTSIKVMDMEGEWAVKLERHLKSEDFFGSEAHPKAKFEITEVIAGDKAGVATIVGNMTIKGITKEIAFQSKMSEGESGMIAKARVVIDRSEFNVKYRSASFFDDLGDKMIYDEFKLMVILHLPAE